MTQIRGKMTIAFVLSAIMALAPLSACSPGQPGDASADEEMSRSSEMTGEVISVATD